jgi:phosphoglycolate phosphatase
MIKAAIFDMDGVLIDSNYAWYEMFKKTLDHFEKKSISREEFDSNVWAQDFGRTSKEYFSVSKEEVLEHFNSLKDSFEGMLKTFDDVSPTLEELNKRGIKLGVATNTHNKLAKELLEEVDIRKHFNNIVGADDVENAKPAPDMIIKTLDNMKINKEEAIFVGDTKWDRMAAEKANVKFVGFRIDGDKRIEKFSELLEMIK